LAAWVAALKQIIASRPREQQRQLLYDNAVRLYGLTQ
jgi:predicted TIM-barrel fold metal-dependent hydrolase